MTTMTMGDFRDFVDDYQEAITTSWTAATTSFAVWSDAMQLGANISGAQAMDLARQMGDNIDWYQQAVENLLEKQGYDPAYIAQQRSQWTQAMANFQHQGNAAMESLGRAAADAAKRAADAANARGGGTVVDLAQVGMAIADAQQTGDWNKVGEALGSAGAGALAAAFAAALTTYLAGVLGIAGLPLAIIGVTLGVVFVIFSDAFLSDPFSKIFNFIGQEVSDRFNWGMRWIPRKDPLTLDLDGDGIETVGIDNSNPILFDHDGDGTKHATGWIAPDDGLLVLDRNGNGTIDNGRELFGDSTQLPDGTNAADGFAALAVEDTNGDGVVNSADARFNELRVWRDLNQDGESQYNELFTLQELGITAIHVEAAEHSEVLPNGNQIADVGTYERNDGTSGAVTQIHSTADVDLIEDTFHREFPPIPLAEGITDLPNMRASGAVRDLWEAATQSSDLRALLTSFANATTRDQQRALMYSLLDEWAETAGMSTMEERAQAKRVGLRWAQLGDHVSPGSGFISIGDSSGGGDDGGSLATVATPEDIERMNEWKQALARARYLFSVLEAFNGRYFFQFPEDPLPGAASGSAVITMSNDQGTTGGSGGGLVSSPVFVIALSQVQLDALEASYDILVDSVYDALVVQTRIRTLTDMIVMRLLPEGLEYDFTAMNSELQQRIQANTLNGMADLIELTTSQHTPLLTAGWTGLAMVEQYIRTLPTSPALAALYEETGVLIGAATGDHVVGDRDNEILLAQNVNTAMSGNDGDDVLIGADGNDTLYGGKGQDALFGHGGDDSLEGGVGDDRLIGGAGNDGLYGDGYAGGWLGVSGVDILEGGAGNDFLLGGYGSDTYLFSRGDGQDTINNVGDNYGSVVEAGASVDVLQFQDIDSTDVALTRVGADLIISVTGTTDRVTVASYFVQDALSPLGYAIDEIRFADGVVWTPAQARELILLPTEGDDTLTGFTLNDTVNGAGGNDTIIGLAGNDTLNGGAGNDQLEGNDGNDVLDGGDGDDQLVGEVGDDHLLGGAGNDNLYGEINVGGYGGRLGNDILDGGAGDDLLVGGFGSDTYLFGRGDGQDIIANDGDAYAGEIDPTVDKVDVLQFKEGVAPGDILLIRSGENLILRIAGTTDQVSIANYFRDDGINPRGYALEEIRFADGTTWDIATVKALSLLPTADHDTIVGYATNDTINGGDGNDNLYGASGNDSMNGGAGDDLMEGDDGHDTMEGGDGNDNLYGEVGDDHLIGGAGNDYLYGEINVGGWGDLLGNDILDGGAGNDVLMGGFGSDTYLFGHGDGQDFINNEGDSYGWTSDPTVGKIDVLQFKQGVSVSDVELSRSGFDLVIKLAGTTDQITVHNYFFAEGTSPRGFTLEQIRFADGISWSYAAVSQMLMHGTEGDDVMYAAVSGSTIYGMGGNDTLHGNVGADVLDGGDGVDALWGAAGNDHLIGGAGDDNLYGESNVGGWGGVVGHDILNGGAGNDTLIGGFGNDTYVFGRGDGQDIIVNDGDSYGGTIDPTVNKIDVLQFKEDVAPGDVSFSRSGNDLIAKIAGTADQATLVSYFLNDGAHARGYAVEQVRFADGTIYDIAALKALALLPTAGNDTITGYASDDTIDGGDGNDTIYGADGNDAINGDSGSDVIEGDAGNDTIQGGDGVDVISGEAGDDHLIGGDGDDSLYGEINVGGWGGVVGHDILDGGAGNDTLIGGFGNDTYLFGRGDGQDIIGNDGDSYGGTIDPTVGKTDVLQFDADIAVGDVALSRSGNNLIINVTGTTDQVTVVNYFINDGAHPRGYAIEQIRFADGTIWDIATVKDIVLGSTAAADTVVASTDGRNTLSLGGALSYADLTFAKSGNNLVLGIGGGEQVTQQNWYGSSSNRSVVTLQVVAEAMAAFASDGSDPLLDDSIEQFGFLGLVDTFDQARAATPTLTSWALSNALLDFHTGGSDTQALGGDPAYRPGLNGNLTGIGVGAAQAAINDPQFGSAAQPLNPVGVVFSGDVRLA